MSPSVVLRGFLDHHGVLDHFDHWSFSDEVGCFKPFPPIFEHAMSGLGVPEPGEIAHVGDGRRTDVAGALAMGMTAVRATWFADRGPETGPEGHHVADPTAPEAPPPVPWHFKLMLALLVAYLGWRLVQFVAVLF